MFKGGYHIVDFKNSKFTTEKATNIIYGVYESIEGSYGKPLVLTGLNFNKVEYKDAFISVRIEESKYIIDSLYGLKITIDNTDSVNVVYVNPSTLVLSDE
jgi:hypothetical protein